MERPLVYLAGLINPVAPQSITWRKTAASLLELREIYTIDPLRAEPITDKSFQTDGMESGSISSGAIFARSRRDATRCDIFLGNLSQYNSKRPPFGTLFEMAWAHEYHIPIIAFVDLKDQARWMLQHPFTQVMVAEYHNNLFDAVEAVHFYV